MCASEWTSIGEGGLWGLECRLLDVIDLPGYPPCLVFERGDVTLDEWIEKARPSLMMRKAVLFEVYRLYL